ncbi:LuxR C-terminal-related transcriptional regulator [Kitasatospora sp. NBC_01287]|uniref:helix-turn-helix transcriptional regulator n=1 Tax=Kitasatospora sp. NBC_01287 TaxID=2903573 RepID=UPI00224CC55E|nr:LuxR C-terminal-related transcriptional regulator [Kitasatospora sp. NBC_01287]MCX4746058.1 LuxR C-terminal-related transcriptional regulator [Kitasatospora sp. NBC_01287]
MLNSEENPKGATAPVRLVLGLGSELRRFEFERVLNSSGFVGELTTTANAAGAIAAAGRLAADLVVVALAELDRAVVAALAAAGAAGPRVLLLVEDVAQADLAKVTSVRSAGVLDAAELTPRAVRECLERIAAGEVPIPSALAQRLLTPGWAPVQERTLPRLTPREQEVLPLLVDGLSNKQIARRLGISEHGAKRLVANILAKLDSPNRTCAVTRALREGLYEQCLEAAS